MTTPSPTLPVSAGTVWDAPTAAMVERLRRRFGTHAFGIVERWDADVCSVGLVRGHEACALAIISTCDCGVGRYDVVLERGPLPGCEGEFTSAGRRRDVDYDTLERLLADHLGLD